MRNVSFSLRNADFKKFQELFPGYYSAVFSLAFTSRNIAKSLLHNRKLYIQPIWKKNFGVFENITNIQNSSLKILSALQHITSESCMAIGSVCRDDV